MPARSRKRLSRLPCGDVRIATPCQNRGLPSSSRTSTARRRPHDAAIGSDDPELLVEGLAGLLQGVGAYAFAVLGVHELAEVVGVGERLLGAEPEDLLGLGAE